MAVGWGDIRVIRGGPVYGDRLERRSECCGRYA